jgi:hypothetical protein
MWETILNTSFFVRPNFSNYFKHIQIESTIFNNYVILIFLPISFIFAVF